LAVEEEGLALATRPWPSRRVTLAWNYALRGYDAVQLASALTWQESVGMEVIVGTFDRQLWTAARHAGMKAWPEEARVAVGRGGRTRSLDCKTE
jgi:hypothetical protein